MKLRAYLRVRPGVRRLLDLLDLLEYRVELEYDPVEPRWDDSVTPPPNMGVEGGLGTITVRTGDTEPWSHGEPWDPAVTVPGPDDF